MTSRYVARIGPKVFSDLGKMAYNMSGFNRYGLHRDDCLYENKDVIEALRRLNMNDPDTYDQRVWRCYRALHLSLTKRILPQDQWIKYEEDVKYLEPYLEEVIKERQERFKFDYD